MGGVRLGDPTAYLAGQVTLSPWPHVRRSPMGMLVVPVLSSLTQGWAIGWASAPHDADWAERHPRRAAVMALAGPLGNLAVAAVAFAIIQAGMWAGWFEPVVNMGIQQWVKSALPPDPLLAGDFIARALSVLLSLNLLLFVFNLLPLPPLGRCDGDHADAARCRRPHRCVPRPPRPCCRCSACSRRGGCSRSPRDPRSLA
jgi:Zn-dependent protease